MSNKNLITINTSTALSRVSNVINVTNNLLQEYFNSNERRIYEYLNDFKDEIDAINIISLYYPLTEEMLLEYKEVLNWSSIVRNKSIKWNEDCLFTLVEQKYLHIVHLVLFNTCPSSPDWVNKFLYLIDSNNLQNINESALIFMEDIVIGHWGEELQITRMYDSFEARLEQLPKFKDFIWNYIFLNSKLDLTDELIKKCEDNWDWDLLSKNITLSWTNELLEKYVDKWNWEYLSQNSSIPWTLKIIENFVDRLDWDSLSKNRVLPWSMDLIENFCSKWNWYILSDNSKLPWSVQLIEKFKERWSWSNLTTNLYLPWSEDLMLRYIEKWDWKKSLLNRKFPWTNKTVKQNLQESYVAEAIKSSDINFPFTIELLESNFEILDWGSISMNESIPWTKEILEKFKENLEWYYLSSDRGLPWNEELIKNYKDYWDWEDLSRNFSLPWTIDLIERFKDNWCWYGLSRNLSIPWSNELIEKYHNRWNWENLSKNVSCTLTDALIEKYFININIQCYFENLAKIKSYDKPINKFLKLKFKI